MDTKLAGIVSHTECTAVKTMMSALDGTVGDQTNQRLKGHGIAARPKEIVKLCFVYSLSSIQIAYVYVKDALDSMMPLELHSSQQIDILKYLGTNITELLVDCIESDCTVFS